MTNLDDVLVLILVTSLVACFSAALGILARKFGTVRKTMTEMERVSSATESKLDPLVNTVNEMRTEVKSVSPSVQLLGQFATDLGQKVDTVCREVGKMEEHGRRYDELEKDVRNIHNVLVGSYTKGKAGEQALEAALELLSKMGRVKTKVPLGGGIVEYAVVLDDGKVLPIDSKVVANKEVERLHDNETKPDEKAELEKTIRKRVQGKMAEVQKYIDPEKTSPMAVLALPDSVMGSMTDLVPEATSRNIILLGYSGIPQLIPYFIKIYGSYAVAKDAKKLQQSIEKIQQDLNSLNDEFFFNHFKKPLTTLDGAYKTAEKVVLGIRSALTADASPHQPRLAQSKSSPLEDTSASSTSNLKG